MRTPGSRGIQLGGKFFGRRKARVFVFVVDRRGSRESDEILGTKNSDIQISLGGG
jgi:hypothetical protein